MPAPGSPPGIPDWDLPDAAIVRVEAFALRRTFDGTAWNPAWRWHERNVPVLRLTAADGTQGLGEGWSDPASPAAFYPPARQAARHLLRHGTLPTPAGPMQAAACSALDIALWDLRARQAGQPLHRLLGAGDREASGCASTAPKAPVYASGGLYADGKGPDALAAEFAGYAALGFTTFKMKLGALPLAADMARVAAVRAAIGPTATLIVDAVGRLSPGTAPAWCDALAGLGVTHIQAPLPASDLDGLAALQARGPLAVIAGEAEHDPASLHRLVRARAVALLQWNPGLAGGITGSLALLAMARRAGIPATLQCYSTAILQSACFHLAAGRPGIHSAEYHRFHDTLYEALPPAMTAVGDGGLALDDTPGLGIELPEHPARSTLAPVFDIGV